MSFCKTIEFERSIKVRIIMSATGSLIEWLKKDACLGAYFDHHESALKIVDLINSAPIPFGLEDPYNKGSRQMPALYGSSSFLRMLFHNYSTYIKWGNENDINSYVFKDDYAKLGRDSLRKLVDNFSKKYETIKGMKPSHILDNTERLSLINDFNWFRIELSHYERSKSENTRRSNKSSNSALWGKTP